MDNLGIQIKLRRKALKLNQQELANLANLSINTIVAIEKGTGNPRLSTILTICDILGLQLSSQLKN